MKRLIYMLLALALLSSCQGQKKIIEEKVPMYLWKEMLVQNTIREFDDFRKGCVDHGLKVLEQYEAEHRKDRAEKEQMAMYGGTSWNKLATSIDFINALSGTPSNLRYDPYKDNVKKYSKQVGFAGDRMAEKMAEECYALSSKISLKKDIDAIKCEIKSLPIDIIIDSLVGQPTAVKTLNEDYVADIAGTVVMNSFKKTRYPEISTMTYNKETTYWTVRFYGTDATVEVAVKKEKDENGEPVLDYKIIGLDAE